MGTAWPRDFRTAEFPKGVLRGREGQVGSREHRQRDWREHTHGRLPRQYALVGVPLTLRQRVGRRDADMPFAIDLNPRQSARTLEQAIRHRAQVLVEPRIWEESEPLCCRLEPCPDTGSRRDSAGRTLVLSYDLASETPLDHKSRVEQFCRLVGSYCDLAIRLGENVYLFSSDVVKVVRPVEPMGMLYIHVIRPETLQVAQRRRYRRLQVAESSKVRVSWRREGEPADEGIGWLCNISADGLAFRTDMHFADRLLIGEPVRVDFTLSPTDSQRFVFDAIVCGKIPAGTEGKTIVGVQFQTDSQQGQSRQMAEALRQKLCDRSILASRASDEESL